MGEFMFHPSQLVLVACVGVVVGVAALTYETPNASSDNARDDSGAKVVEADNSRSAPVEFEATVVREPAVLRSTQRFDVRTASMDGFVRVNAGLLPKVAVGDVLHIACTLEEPEPFDGFRYDRYLERYHVVALCRYPRVEHIGVEHSWHTALFAFKQRMVDGIQQSVAAPEHTLILGVVLGLTNAVPDEVLEQFRRTGTSHVLVISGMNVSVLVMMLSKALIHVGLSRRRIVWAVVPLLVVYVIITGVQPSATRAAVCGGVVLLAQTWGRPGAALRVLLYAAALMLLVNPLLFWYDAGFQLSFAATAGILLLNKWSVQRLWWVPETFELRETLASTVSASIATVPIIAYSFQNFSPISFVTNLLMVPLMNVVLLYGMALVAVSLLWIPLAVWAGLPLYILMHVGLAVVEWSSRVPYASVVVLDFPAWVVAGVYLHITLSAWVLWMRRQQEQRELMKTYAHATVG